MKKFILFLFLASTVFAQQSRYELKSYYSTIFNTSKKFYIFLPQNYDSTSERYPVVYLFRGAASEWTSDGQDASRKGSIKTVADSLIRNGSMGNVILVMPDFSAPPISNDYLSFFNEMVPYVDKTFRTYKSRWLRGIDGFSLGGLTTLTMMSTHPEYFSTIGSYDGTFSMFTKSLLTNASPDLIEELKRLKILFHASAPTGPSNYNNNLDIVNLLKQKGVPNTFDQLLLAPSAEHNWYYADLHMSLTFPFHYKRFFQPQQNIPLQILSPTNSQKLSETITVAWNKIQETSEKSYLNVILRSEAAKNLTFQFKNKSEILHFVQNDKRQLISQSSPRTSDSVTAYIFISSDDGKSWKFLTQQTSSDTSFQLNTLQYADGALYKFRVMAIGDTIFSIAETPRITIDNVGNGAPYILFSSVDSVMSGVSNIQWDAGDPEDDSLKVSVALSYDNKKSWNVVATNLANTGTFDFNTTSYSNSSNVFLKLTVSDGTIENSSVTSFPITINNPRTHYPTSILKHTSGVSTAAIAISKDAHAPQKTDTYEIQFSNTALKKHFSVTNKTTNTQLLSNIAWNDAVTESPSFDGFHIIINDPAESKIVADSLRWILSTSQLNGFVGLVDIVLDNQTLEAQPTPYDFEVKITEQISDTSLQIYDVSAIPTYFTVYNTTLQKKTSFVFIDFNGDSKISDLDELYLFEKDTSNILQLSWHVVFTGSTGALPPSPNDAFRIVTTKPLENDTYEFTSYPLSVDANTFSPNQYEVFQNFPNPFNPETIIRYQTAKNDFVTLKVYDMLGREVALLVNEFQPAGNYTINFNAVKYALSSGVYFYALTSGSSGNFSSIKKMLLLK